MHIVLDSNIIIAEKFGLSPQFRELISTLTLTRHTVYLPRPVIEEVVNEFLQIFDEGVNEITKGSRILSRRLAIDVQVESESFPDKYEQSTSLRHRLEGNFDNSLCVVVEYPDTPLAELGMRAISRRKPFKQNGAGLIDSIIWETTLKLAKELDGPIVLLSNNSRDFGDEKRDLHADLKKELTDRGLSANKVVLIGSLADFIRCYVVPILPKNSLEDVAEIFTDSHFEKGLKHEIEELYSQYVWEPEELGLKREHEREEISFICVNEMSQLKLTDVRKVSEGRFILSLNVEINSDLGVDIEGEEDDDFTHSSGSIYGVLLQSQLSIVVDNSDSKKREMEILSFDV